MSDNVVLESSLKGIVLDAESGLYPENNTFVNNSFSNVASYDFRIQDVGINGSWLVDQPVSSYYINDSIVYFKDSSYGMVEFLEGINATGSNLSGDVRIGSNLISVNSSQSGLNKSANLTLYNTNSLVGSGNRIILRDGVDCPSSICTELDDADTYIFNVTGFTNYSVGNNSLPVLNFVNVTDVATTFNGLNCTFNVTDVDSVDLLYVNYTWLKDGVVNRTGQVLVSAGQFNYTSLGYGNTTQGDNWTCQVTPYDGYAYGSSQNDSVVVDNCGMSLDQSLTLGSDIDCSETAITIGASNIVLDCAGFNITYSISGGSGYGVSNDGFDNVTIKNCNIIEGNSTTNHKYGINFLNSTNLSLVNNTITTIGTNSYGIRFNNIYR